MISIIGGNITETEQYKYLFDEKGFVKPQWIYVEKYIVFYFAISERPGEIFISCLAFGIMRYID